VVSEQTAANLRRYAAAWGVLMITARSGVKDEANRVVDGSLPGLLAELCGSEVEEYDSLPPGKSNAIRFAGPEPAVETEAKVEVWCEILHPLQADILGVYTQDFYAGRPAMTHHSVGRGTVVYIGTFGKQDLLRPVVSWLLKLADIEPLISSSAPGLEIVERRQGERSLLFVLNHSDQEQWVRLEGMYQDLITGSQMIGTVPVGSRDLLILEVQKASVS
jgi:beta-galactosidase